MTQLINLVQTGRKTTVKKIVLSATFLTLLVSNALAQGATQSFQECRQSETGGLRWYLTTYSVAQNGQREATQMDDLGQACTAADYGRSRQLAAQYGDVWPPLQQTVAPVVRPVAAPAPVVLPARPVVQRAPVIVDRAPVIVDRRPILLDERPPIVADGFGGGGFGGGGFGPGGGGGGVNINIDRSTNIDDRDTSCRGPGCRANGGGASTPGPNPGAPGAPGPGGAAGAPGPGGAAGAPGPGGVNNPQAFKSKFGPGFAGRGNDRIGAFNGTKPGMAPGVAGLGSKPSQLIPGKPGMAPGVAGLGNKPGFANKPGMGPLGARPGMGGINKTARPGAFANTNSRFRQNVLGQSRPNLISNRFASGSRFNSSGFNANRFNSSGFNANRFSGGSRFMANRSFGGRGGMSFRR
jgi:hypothetical protein